MLNSINKVHLILDKNLKICYYSDKSSKDPPLNGVLERKEAVMFHGRGILKKTDERDVVVVRKAVKINC